MAKVAVVTDSTAYIPTEHLDKHHITVVPQVLIWGEETYEDGVTIQSEEVYRRLATAKVMPTTSQVSIVNMQKAFSGLVEQGYEVLGIFISSLLSGTVQSAIQGREALGNARDKIELVDSYTTAMAMGFQVLAAARAAEQGASLAECKTIAQAAQAHTGVYFMVDTLDFLHRGGRIGGGQRFLGNALNLKPILMIEGGKVEAKERVRTKGKALERLIEIVAEQCDGKAPVRLATLHANAPADGEEVLKRAAQQIHPVETIFTSVSPVIGTHTGPGTIGLAYMTGM